MSRKNRDLSLTMKPLTKSELQKLRQQHVRSWSVVVKPLKDEVRKSEQLTDRDFAIRINARA